MTTVQLDLDTFAAETRQPTKRSHAQPTTPATAGTNRAYHTVHELARTSEHFISDAVWAAGLGGVMRRAARTAGERQGALL